MNAVQFWIIVDRAASPSGMGYKQVVALKHELEQLSEDQLVSFEEHFNTFFNAACTPGLWDAATIILGECSEPKFDEFRAWLIQQGQEAFEAGLKNPDDLSPFVRDTAESLRTLKLAEEIHGNKTKQPFAPKVVRAANTVAECRTARTDLPCKYSQLNKAFPYLERALKRAAERASVTPSTAVSASVTGSTLSREAFWQMIDECRPPLDYLDEIAMTSAIKDWLGKLPISEVVSFQYHVDQLMFASYKASLWEIATIILSGCSDDAFDYVRGWLIAMGPHVYNSVLADAQRIIDFFQTKDEPTCQAILTVAAQVFAQRNNGAVLTRADLPPLVLDRALASEKRLKQIYPALWQRFR